ncbi:MAG: TetR/AcrR family transcriptional regulator [Mycobacterium sp.]
MPRTSSRPQTQVRRNAPASDVGTKGLRTRTRILAETRRLLMKKGYDATSITDITEASGIRRASFYTYFVSKEDVLLTLGQDAKDAGVAAAEGLRSLTPAATIADVATWVAGYLAFWDEHGPFINAAFQAAYVHQELRQWSITAEMEGARIMGQALVNLRGGKHIPGVDPLTQGLAIQSMLERFWYHWRVSGASVKQSTISLSIAQIIWASAHSDMPLV